MQVPVFPARAVNLYGRGTYNRIKCRGVTPHRYVFNHLREIAV